jgi:hypothetical protein
VSDLAAASTAWVDPWWDPEVALLWNMDGSFDDHGMPGRSVHLVPQSAWYAAALLHRGGDGDVERAVRTIDAVIGTQYDRPGTVWHGTYARFLEWDEPGDGPVEWVDYDPNWRQFVGTTFSLILELVGDDLPIDLVSRMRASVDLAVDGEPPDRVPPHYSNIALMKAWLDVESGHTARGEALAEQVVELFRRTGAFLEYGSPTYYGIDLYALALWRRVSSSPRLREWGAELEAALWRDVARWYHADLRNLCGPYARSYGMDMTRYAGILGLWVWDAAGRDVAPFPDLGDTIEHAHDLTIGGCIQILGSRVPDDVLRALRAFPGEHAVEQVVSDELGFVATGWLGDDLMVGGATGVPWRAEGQFHPATVHWRAPDGSVGWLKLLHAGPLDATASERRLDVVVHDHGKKGSEPTTVASSHPGTFEPGRWRFPGLEVRVEGDVTAAGPTFDTPGGTRFTLSF